MKEILLSVREKYLQEGESAVEEDNDWYIYEPDDILSLSTPCYIASRPEFDENDEEIFLEYAIERHDIPQTQSFLTGKVCWGHRWGRNRRRIFSIKEQGQRSSGRSAGKN